MTLAELLSNPILTGIFGGSLAASLLYLVRGIPKSLFDLLLWRFTSEVMIFNDDAVFDTASEWLGTLTYTKKARNLRLTSEYSDHEQRSAFTYSPGIGTHLIWFRKRPVFVVRNSPPDKSMFGKRQETICIRTLGPSPALLHTIIKTISDTKSKAGTHVEVFLYQSYWRKVARKEKRQMESVILPPDQRSRIIKDIERFRASRPWYRERGIPYRRGLLLTGSPGTGKTSLVLALAAHFGLRVYAINLGSLRGDNELIDAVTSVPEDAILLIEDIDVAQHKRDEPAPVVVAAPTPGPHPPDSPKDEKVTLSGLLNALDGVFSRDGRILIMTTNYPERLDSALKRPGRADLTEELTELGTTEIREMCRQFLGDEEGDQFAGRVKSTIRPAVLQKVLLQKHNGVEVDPEAVEPEAPQESATLN